MWPVGSTHPNDIRVVAAWLLQFHFIFPSSYILSIHNDVVPWIQAKYAPSVDQETLRKLALSFGELRRLNNEGVITYPYSMRELVNIVSHLEKYSVEVSNVIISFVRPYCLSKEAVLQTVLLWRVCGSLCLIRRS